MNRDPYSKVQRVGMVPERATHTLTWFDPMGFVRFSSWVQGDGALSTELLTEWTGVASVEVIDRSTLKVTTLRCPIDADTVKAMALEWFRRNC